MKLRTLALLVLPLVLACSGKSEDTGDTAAAEDSSSDDSGDSGDDTGDAGE